ncbi:MAG: VWA domain-containing protein [Kofleriaceae bacterium]
MRKPLLLVSMVSLAACGGGGADAPGGDDDGGGVGFGGAQDIGEFRGILDRGEIPGPSTLDANGFFNEHFNPAPQVTCGGPLCLTPGLSVGRDFITGGHQATLQISINTTVNPADHPRLPMKLVVVVDHSGSMAEDQRLEKVKLGLHTMIDNLGAEDRLAILSFDDVVTTNAPFTGAANKDVLHTAVNSLQPRGGTNIFEGLQAGLDLLGDVPENEKQNRVIFLSDGLATVGNTSQQAIIDMATTKIEHGIGLTTIGVGNDFDVELMRGLAERGAGNFYFVEDASAAQEVFTEELDFFMEPLALDLRIDATAAQGWNFREVTGTKLWTAADSTGMMQVPAVFFASRTSQGGEQGRRGGGSMIFVNLEPTSKSPGKVATVKLSYRLPNSQERISHEVVLDYDSDPTEDLADPHLSYAEMSERYAMYNIFLGLRLATEYSVSNYDCAAAALTATRNAALVWSESHEGDPDVSADIVLMDQFLANLAERGATGDLTLSTCPNADNPYPGDDHGYDDTQYAPMACSAGHANAGWLLVLGALGLVVRRRRRRS